ncbi:MAG: signal peptidase I [Lentisphaeria bacterium]|nr:signal peptidase I [Lentisphaeria bacterium]
MMIDFFIKRKKRKFLSELRSRRHDEDDLLNNEQRQRFDEVIERFAQSAPEDFDKASAKAVKEMDSIVPPYSRIRNLLDLLIVVGAVAFGIRGLFFQPFKIPTGSMQPTLYGIHYMNTTPLGKNLPGFLNYVLFASRKAHLEVQEDGEVQFRRYKNSFFSDAVEFSVGRHIHTLPGSPQKVMEYSGLQEGMECRKGEVRSDGFLSMGDHLFVERFSIYLCPPQRGEVMIFTTDGLRAGGEPLSASSGFYYVKRLVAMPGDTVRLKDNQLYVKPAGEKEFKKIQHIAPRTARLYSGKGGYQGHLSVMGDYKLFGADEDYVVPADHYFMLGDNSAFSLDSRFFGAVPRRNLVGRSWFIFWPFSRRWGLTDRLDPIDEPTGNAVRGTFPVMYRQ